MQKRTLGTGRIPDSKPQRGVIFKHFPRQIPPRCSKYVFFPK